MPQMVEFYINILILSGSCITSVFLEHFLMICSFYKYVNVEVYLNALTLLNIYIFLKIFRCVLGNFKMKLYDL